MDITPYLTRTVSLERFIEGNKSKFGREGYSSPQQIPCMVEPGVKYIPSGETVIRFNTSKYTTLEKVVAKDKLNGQVVDTVNEVLDFDGSVSHYESSIGKAL